MSIVTNTALKAALEGVAAAVEGQIEPLYNPNLLLGTSDEWLETASNPLKLALAEDIEEGETLTLSFDVELGEGNKNFLIYNSGWGCVQDGYINPVDGRACKTFQWKYRQDGANNTELWMQRRPDGVTTANRYRRIKLERGCVATRWCPAERESALRCVQGELDGLQQAAAAAQATADAAGSAATAAKTTANSALTAATTAKTAADAAQSTATAAKTAADAAKADGAAAMGKAQEVEGKLAGMCNPNLLGGTSDEWTETAATLKVPIVGDIAEGETVTLSLDLEPGADVKSFLIYNSGWKGSQDCGHMVPVDGKAQKTWQWKYPTQGDVNVELWLQPRPDGTTGVNRMRCIKLERGPVATPWCRAESDMALRSELEELRAVDIELSALDTMGRSDWSLVTALQIARGTIASRRYYGVCSDGKPVGTLEFFSDDQSHVLIQRLTTLATPNSDGSGFFGHNHNEMRCYWRRYNILASISGVDKGTWSKWEEQEPKGMREELNRLQVRSSAGRVMSVSGTVSHPEQNVLDNKLVVNGVVDVALSEDDYFVFGVSTVNPTNGVGMTMLVTYFEGAEAFGSRQGNAVYPAEGCVLIDRSNGKMYCMEYGSLKTISG